MSTPPALVGRGLTQDFGDFRAVDDVTLHVAAGEVVGLLGANGAGKTTTLRMLLGLLRPTAGEVALLGRAPDRTARRRLGYVPQSLGLYTTLSVAENVAFAAGVHDLPPPPLGPELQPHRDVLVRDLPLGLARQLAFHIALAHSPEVLVLDEPTSGVGPLGRARLWEQIVGEADRGVAVLVTTHYMQEAGQCDRLLLMARGRLVAQGSHEDVVAGTSALAVRTHDEARAFAVLSDAGEVVVLDGTTVRVVDADPQRVASLLAAAAIEADLEEVPVSLDERMAALAREG